MGRRAARAGTHHAAVLGLALALLLAACGGGSRSGAAVGRAAPGFSTFDLAGHPVRLANVDGPVLVNFWASWCVPCRTEFPMLASVQGKGVTVLGVVFHDSSGDASAFMREFGATWPGLVDPKGQIASAYGVRPKPGIPVTFALDRSHVVRAKHLGPLSSGDLNRLVVLIRA